MRDQLVQARDILELGLQNVSYARQTVALTDGKSIADVSWDKVVSLTSVSCIFRQTLCFRKLFHRPYGNIFIRICVSDVSLLQNF